MADGNETNAWQDEAVINPLKYGEYSYKHCFGDDDWKN